MKNDILRPLRIGKVLMIRHDMFLVERILLHAYKVLHVVELALHNAIVFGPAVELRAYELFHQGTGFGCVVCLSYVMSEFANGYRYEFEYRRRF